MTDARRRIPSTDQLLRSSEFTQLLASYPRERVVRGIRQALEALRGTLQQHGGQGDHTAGHAVADAVLEVLRHEDRPSLRSVINATGVVLHTNLGRAPLARAAREAMLRAAKGYGNVEFDLDEGVRGSRYHHCVSLLRELTGAEGALVVNNNAAALVLALNTVARDRGVAVSRGELVEIGGGFRIPEILERAGARLVEVGSTNRTRLTDYRAAVEAGDVAAVLKVHRSNFRMEGFTEEASLGELRGLTAEVDLPLLYDLGSGLMVEARTVGLPDEPRAADAVGAGVDAVAISGDKLLGGPQAGILVGRSERIEAMRDNALCRALRVDKVTLAGLEATLRLYRDPHTVARRVPTLRLLSRTSEELRKRAEAVLSKLGREGGGVELIQGGSPVGGGTFPGVTLPTWTVALPVGRGGARALAAQLRGGDPPVVGRIEGERVHLDLRTVLEDEVDALVQRLREVLI